MLVKSENCAVISYMIQSIVWLQYVKYIVVHHKVLNTLKTLKNHPISCQVEKILKGSLHLIQSPSKSSDHLILFLPLSKSDKKEPSIFNNPTWFLRQKFRGKF